MKHVNDRNSHTGLTVLAGAALLAAVANAGAADTWQERLLFDPPQSQLDAEARGRIMIYDGLTATQITQAMDEQFERIGSMMFVRTIQTDARGEPLRDAGTGAVVVDDDGC
jgi:hypothetical protein